MLGNVYIITHKKSNMLQNIHHALRCKAKNDLLNHIKPTHTNVMFHLKLKVHVDYLEVMMFNIDEYLNIIGKLPLNMRFLLG